MTAVSNPNNRPPRAATTVLLIKYPFNFGARVAGAALVRGKLGFTRSRLLSMERSELRNSGILELCAALIHE